MSFGDTGKHSDADRESGSDPDVPQTRADLRAAPFAGCRVTVMGLGLFGGGVGVARWLIASGARVTVTDLRSSAELAASLAALAGLPYRGVFGGHAAEDFARAEVVVANPAVPPSNELLGLARERGARITSEVGLFLERCPARWIGVTGTHGKSSTATFTAQLAASVLADRARVRLGGNIGGSLLDALAPLAAAPLEADDVVVLELSSYQLEALAIEGLQPLRPAAAVAITNVSADHLDRHGSVAAYLAVKRSIAALGDARTPVLVPADDARLAGRAPGEDRGEGESDAADLAWHALLRTRLLRVAAEPGNPAELTLSAGCFRLHGEPLAALDALAVPGAFQRRNALTALGLVVAAGLVRAPDPRLSEAIRALRAPEHRMQDLGERAGHRVWDNAVATTPESTLCAVRELSGSFVCVLGGRDKGLDWGPLARALAARGARAIAFGSSGPRIAGVLAAHGVPASVTDDVAAAVRAAWRVLANGEPLLFSPGCASFDAYRNFAERASAFRRALDDVADAELAS